MDKHLQTEPEVLIGKNVIGDNTLAVTLALRLRLTLDVDAFFPLKPRGYIQQPLNTLVIGETELNHEL